MFYNFYCSLFNHENNKSSSLRFLNTSPLMLRQLNYYEILGVKNDCTPAEIRDAFVKKSKQNHPDMKQSAGSDSKEFIQVMEAYKVLSKSHSRTNYDMHLQGIDRMNFVSQDTFHEPWKAEKMSKAKDQPYYGIKGIKKVANWKIVVVCVIFCTVGSVIQAFAIKKSFTFKRNEMLDRSARFSETLAKVKEDSEKYGFDEQIERMLQRMNKER